MKITPIFFIILILSNIPSAFSQDENEDKPIIAVYDLKANEVPIPLAKALTDRIRDEIFHRDLYRVAARNDIEDVLKEQGFQLSGACDDSISLIEVGKLLGAQYVIGGSISLIGDYYTVSVRIVEVNTGEVVKSHSSSKYFNTENLLNKGSVEIVDNLISERKKYSFLTSPYFWGGVAITVATGTAVYLQMANENASAGTPSGTAEVIVNFP